MKNILLIDDDKLFHESFNQTVSSDKISCFFAINQKQAIKQIEKTDIHMIFLDLDLGNEYGLDILENILSYEIPVCILSGTATIRTTIEALKKGAVDLVEKPISKTHILKLIDKYSEISEKLIKEFSWKSKKMQEIEENIAYLANTPAKILLRGETGVGKEVIARQIHDFSSRKNKNFVAVNCGAIPENLIEHELFGSKKGAFTGAHKDHIGLIKEADGGTIFLDEIADLPLNMQVKILRFLQESEIRALGSSKDEKVDVRIIAATHKNLEEMVKNGSFREDLYFRLNVFMIDIPPLRNRIDDLEILIKKIVEKFKFQYKNNLEFLPETIDVLKKHSWSGNIRELSNIIERLMLLVHGPVEPSDLPSNFLENFEEKNE
jgi:DNA-binding NtrC family response regulator